jgi:hypothetical protein
MEPLFRLLYRAAVIFAVPVLLILCALLVVLAQLGRSEA